MNIILSKIISTGVFFLLVFLSGFWLSRYGKPYPVLIFTIHKLIALAAVIFLAVTVYRLHLSAPLQIIQGVGIAIAAVCLIVTFITGALVSLDKVMPETILRIHRGIPYLAVVSVGVTLYLLFLRDSQLAAAS